MFQRFRCCECYKVQNSSLSQQVLSEIVASKLVKAMPLQLNCFLTLI